MSDNSQVGAWVLGLPGYPKPKRGKRRRLL